MYILEILLLSISLSIDALGIGISYGIKKTRIPNLSKFIICIISLIFSYLSLFFGNIILNYINKNYAKLLGCIMLISLGIFIICKSFSKKTSCDFDSSSHIDPIEALYLGSTLSIDSLATGISSAMTGLNSFFMPLSISAFQLLFLIIGSFIGKKLSSNTKKDPKKFVVFSGILLIILSFIRLI